MPSLGYQYVSFSFPTCPSTPQRLFPLTFLKKRELVVNIPEAQEEQN